MQNVNNMILGVLIININYLKITVFRHAENSTSQLNDACLEASLSRLKGGLKVA